MLALKNMTTNVLFGLSCKASGAMRVSLSVSGPVHKEPGLPESGKEMLSNGSLNLQPFEYGLQSG